MPLITSVSDEIIALELGAVVVRGTPDQVIDANDRLVCGPREALCELHADENAITVSIALGGSTNAVVPVGSAVPEPAGLIVLACLAVVYAVRRHRSLLA